MAYPDEFLTTPDIDGDRVSITERFEARDLRFGAADDLAWVRRDDVPEMIEWLQAYYAATEPPKPVLPTTNGSIVRSITGGLTAYRIGGTWMHVESGYKAYPFEWDNGFEIVYDAGEEV